jgi:hypothetical protein
LSGCAFFSASTAVIEICLGIEAQARAISETRGASAFAASAEFATSTFSATGAAVVEIAFGIDT